MIIKNRNELLSLINTNFDYLTTEGFRIVDVDIPESKSWSVTFEGKCRIRIEWNWHDGVDILASKSESLDYKTPKGYVIEILIYYLLGKEIVEQYYDDKHGGNSLENITAYSQFLQTHLDKIVEFVSSAKFEHQNAEIQQAGKALLDLQIQRIKRGRSE